MQPWWQGRFVPTRDFGGDFVTRSGHQSRKGRGNIPVAGTNHGRGERIYPKRAPITEGEREYTRSGHQSRKGRENM
eukprot:8926919-Pyramimonas_sp.AAC.1